MEDYIVKNFEKNEKKGLILRFKLFFGLFFGKFAKKIKNDEFLSNEIVFWLLLSNFLANLAIWGVILIFMNKIDGNVILHYNVYFGVDSFGNWKKTFIAPLIGIFMFFLDVFLANFFYKNKERIASYILLIALLMAQINLIIYSISISIINY